MKLSDLFDENLNKKKPNLLFIMTDQERHLPQHWPADFCDKHLPAMTRLQQNGVSFTHAFTPTCMCSPSRATFLTSQYPTLHGVTTTGSPQPKHTLPKHLVNLATVVKMAGYDTIEWQGKWHLGGTPLDYGFTGWDPPDAGNYLTINDTLGGGTPNNDGRFLQNIQTFLERQSKEPWCLVVSFVNPHDVYVSQYDVSSAGYSHQDLDRIQVPLPENCNETLDNKPRAQQQMSWRNVTHENSMQQYCNFYAYLHTLVDAQILEILRKMDDLQITQDTVIFRFADHGEQALSHGLVEKFYNVYEESIRIPLVISNSQVYTEAQTSDSLTSLLDLVPTIAHLVGVQDNFRDCFYGKSLVPILNDPTTAVMNDDVVHFTYDDIACPGGAPSMIRCIRTREFKYAVYFTEDGSDADWELYNKRMDSDENVNVAGHSEYASIQLVLDETLQALMRDFKTHPSFDWPPKQTSDSRGGLPPPQCR